MKKDILDQYKDIHASFKQLKDLYYKLETEYDQSISEIINMKIKSINNAMSRFNFQELEEEYDQKTVESVQTNFITFKEGINFIENTLYADKYFDILKASLLSRLKVSSIDPHIYKDFGVRDDDNEALATNITRKLLHFNVVRKFKKDIESLARNTISKQRFRSLLDTIDNIKIHESFKFKSIKLLNEEIKERQTKILSFDEAYPDLKEDFHNPFIEDEENKKKGKIKIFGDKGGLLGLRKESFNINRIEYTKKPNGSYMLMSKTTFSKGETVEICPIMILGIECKAVNKLKDIVFELDKATGEFALVFGYGSMYRHSESANVEYAYNKGSKQMYFIAKRFIKVGEELTVNYGSDYWAERNGLSLMVNKPGEGGSPEEERPVGDISNNPLLNVKESADIQPSLKDEENIDSTQELSKPNNSQNPVRSGVAIQGIGQS